MARHNITAIIYDKRGRVISIGKNSYVKTHPFQGRLAAATGTPDKVFLHAEIAALVRLKDWSKAHSMLITRYLKDGTEGLSKPCACCQLALTQAGIRNVQYTGI